MAEAEAQKLVEFREQAYEVESQTPDITPEMVAEAGKLTGRWLRSQTGTQQFTEQGIRAYALHMGTHNPLFTDPDYAKKTRWGGVIAPYAMLLGPHVLGPGLRGVQWIFAGTEWEFDRPVRSGEFLSSVGRLIEQEEKRGGAVPFWIMQKGEMIYTNGQGDRAARCITYMARTPRAKAKQGGMGYKPRTQRWTDAELTQLEAEMFAEEVRGSTPRYWEDVQVGEEMSPVVYGPLTTEQIALVRGGAFTSVGPDGLRTGAFIYELQNRRRHPSDSYLDPETGMHDQPHRGHWEEYMALEVGMPGIYDLGRQRLAWLCRFVVDWIGDDAFVKREKAYLRRPNIVGDITRYRGTVINKYVENGDTMVDLELKGINQLNEATIVGTASVVLPNRAGA